MEKITFIFLFFCLAITTILAQVVTTNISAPNSSGLSNNQVVSFDVNSDGTILNNSAASGTATLGSTAVTANSNITAGSEADLILFQVTGTAVSDLDGTIEVFGTEAGIIIANPNGIDCDGCAFTNVNRVDLVTGSGYDVDTNTFSTIDAADIDITSSGLTAPALKIQTGADFNNAGAIVADTVTIEVTNFADDVSNTGTVSSDSLNLILTDDFRNESNTLNGFNNFRNLTVTTDGLFLNSSALDLDNLTIKTEGIFENREQITADSFTAVVNGFNLFSASARINAVNFTATVEKTFSNSSGVINAASFNITAKEFRTSGSSTIYADTVTIEAPNFNDISHNHNGIVSSDSLNIILTDDFTHTSTSFSGFNNFSDLAITTNGTFTNNATINPTGNLTIAANTFTNNATINPTGNLTITADYTAINQGSIASNSLDLTAHDFFRNLIGGDISVDSLNITAGGKVTNTANITVAGTLSITANNNSTRDDDPAGAFFYVSNRGNITATTLNIAAVDNFYNRGNVTADNFNITSAKSVFFLNEEIDSFVGTYDGGNISLNGDSSFTADSRIENYGNIDLGNNNLTIIADSFTNQSSATVTADTLNLYNVNSFLNDGSIDATINQ